MSPPCNAQVVRSTNACPICRAPIASLQRVFQSGVVSDADGGAAVAAGGGGGGGGSAVLQRDIGEVLDAAALGATLEAAALVATRTVTCPCCVASVHR